MLDPPWAGMATNSNGVVNDAKRSSDATGLTPTYCPVVWNDRTAEPVLWSRSPAFAVGEAQRDLSVRNFPVDDFPYLDHG